MVLLARKKGRMTAMGIIIFKITKLKTLRFKEFKKAAFFLIFLQVY